MNIYCVRSSYRQEGGRHVHRTDNVLAVDLMDAARHVQKQRPKATIWTVAHKGSLLPSMVSAEAMEDLIGEPSGGNGGVEP